MKNTVIIITMTFFIFTTVLAVSAYFGLTIERETTLEDISDYDGPVIKDEQGFDRQLPGILLKLQNENDHLKAEILAYTNPNPDKLGIIPKLDKENAEAQRSYEKEAAAMIAEQKKAFEAMKKVHDYDGPPDAPESAFVKLTETFLEGNRRSNDQRKVIHDKRVENRGKLAGVERERLAGHKDYAEIKVKIEHDNRVYSELSHRMHKEHGKWQKLHKEVGDKETAKPPYSIDGQVIEVGEEQTNYLVINRGEQDHVLKNMRFTVFRKNRRGDVMIVGKIIVRKLHARRAECIILPYEEAQPTCNLCRWRATDRDMRFCTYCFEREGSSYNVYNLTRPTEKVLVKHRDPFRPIIAGDLVWNHDYDQEAKLTFFVADTTPFRSRREIVAFIEESGGVVTKALDTKVDYYVPGSDEESEKEARQARSIGIRIMTVREVFSWFGKPKDD